MEGCVTCGATDEMLFTCRYCERQYCAAHQFPHHACEHFSTPTDAPEGDAADAGTAAEATATDGAPDAAGNEDDPVGPGVDDGSGNGREIGDGAVVLTDEVAPDRAGAPEPAPARGSNGGVVPDADSGPPVRSMDVRRPPNAAPSEPETVTEWMRQQTYLTFVLKVGGLAALFTTTYYTSLAFTLYDPFGLL